MFQGGQAEHIESVVSVERFLLSSMMRKVRLMLRCKADTHAYRVHGQQICSLPLPGPHHRLKVTATAAQQVSSCGNLCSRSKNERRASLDWPHEKPSQRSTATNALTFDIAAIGQIFQQEATVAGEQGLNDRFRVHGSQRQVLEHLKVLSS